MGSCSFIVTSLYTHLAVTLSHLTFEVMSPTLDIYHTLEGIIIYVVNELHGILLIYCSLNYNEKEDRPIYEWYGDVENISFDEELDDCQDLIYHDPEGQEDDPSSCVKQWSVRHNTGPSK